MSEQLSPDDWADIIIPVIQRALEPINAAGQAPDAGRGTARAARGEAPPARDEGDCRRAVGRRLQGRHPL